VPSCWPVTEEGRPPARGRRASRQNAVVALYCTYRDCSESACCDYCQWFRFNGDTDGVYTDDGRCAHPAHPMPADPFFMCEDFH